MNGNGGAPGDETGRRTGMDADMGERHSGGGAPGRRHVHPGGTVPAPGVEAENAALEALLAAALRQGAVDAEGEQRAVAAFRATRDARAQQARTRRRDDWRPREQRRTRRSVKATVAVFLTSLTLGGVAVAGIGSAGFSGDAGGDHGQPSHDATDRQAVRPDPTESHAPGTAASPDRPETAQDTVAHCRAYEAVKDRGKAMDATAWQRLVTAAGGEDNVEAYCAEQLKAAASSADRTGKSGTKGGNGTTAGSGTATPAAPATRAVVPTTPAAGKSRRPGR